MLFKKSKIRINGGIESSPLFGELVFFFGEYQFNIIHFHGLVRLDMNSKSSKPSVLLSSSRLQRPTRTGVSTRRLWSLSSFLSSHVAEIPHYLEIIIESTYGRSPSSQRLMSIVIVILCKKQASTTSPIRVQSLEQKERSNISSQRASKTMNFWGELLRRCLCAFLIGHGTAVIDASLCWRRQEVKYSDQRGMDTVSVEIHLMVQSGLRWTVHLDILLKYYQYTTFHEGPRRTQSISDEDQGVMSGLTKMACAAVQTKIHGIRRPFDKLLNRTGGRDVY
ncbi:hypothetical protein F5146DRAFT_679273 [Armillaria mellea]|nr:hypothetical protein F5146DRAFT_679273 [Armillaria mellea]